MLSSHHNAGDGRVSSRNEANFMLTSVIWSFGRDARFLFFKDLCVVSVYINSVQPGILQWTTPDDRVHI